jgi:aldehyde:ferredoxin oxidoreductase
LSNNCYMGKVLFIDLTTGVFEDVPIEENIYRQYIGGFGLGARILFEKMRPGVDPLGEENILGFIAGPLVGTNTPSAGRFTVVSKSPLTNGWGDSNCGGNFGPEIKKAGYDGVFITGKAERPVYLWLTNESKEIRDAGHLWGIDSIETEKSIKQELGGGVKVVCIGQAGENLSKISGIIHDHGRAAARSGLGAVMGSKNLKAIAIKGNLKVTIADKNALNQIVTPLRKDRKHFLSPIGQAFGKLGTAGGFAASVASQDAPIQNWKGTNDKIYTVEQAEKISGESYEPYKKRRYACAQCAIACSAIIDAKSLDGSFLESHRPEYETIAAFGSMCLIDDVDTVILANHLCNQYGLDTISTGATIAFAMECFEKGIITEKDTSGLAVRWGDKNIVLELIELIAQRKGFGEVLADGVKAAAQKIGRGAEEYAIHAGGIELPMHDPRDNPGWAYTYEFDPNPGHHTQGGLQYHGLHPVLEQVLPENLGEKYDYESKGKGKGQAVYCHWYNFLSSTGLCIFAPLSYKNYPLLEMFRAATGWKNFDLEEALLTGERINTLRQCFNLREGIKPSDFKLPSRVLGIPPLSDGPIAGVTVDVNKVKEKYYTELDWDFDTGKPSKKKLELLGISALIDN